MISPKTYNTWVSFCLRETASREIKSVLKYIAVIISVCFLLLSPPAQAQETTSKKPYTVGLNYFYGNIAQHSKDIAHLITGHPTGFIASYNRKTYGLHEWERLYNYPDWGFSFLYHEGKNEFLGNNFGIYGHYNFYFFQRKLVARIGQGIAYNTNPFDIETNKKNTAYGSHLLSGTYVTVNYQRALFKNITLQAGFSLIHYSNGNAKAPNTSTNTIAATVGLIYAPREQEIPPFIPNQKEKYTEPLHYNFVLRGGINQSDRLGLGRHPFYIASVFVDKRLNKKSTLQLGAEVFFSEFLKEQIRFESVAFPGFGVRGDEDWKRVGVFVGHELRFGRVAFVSQLGYYVYYPYDFEGRVYARIGLKRYFGERIYALTTVKAHGAKAEAVEFGIGYRL